MRIARKGLLPVPLLRVAFTFLVLSSPALSENEKNQVQPIRPAQQSRPVQTFRPVQQFRPAQPVSPIVQRHNAFVAPRTNPSTYRNFNAAGTTNAQSYQPQHRSFGATTNAPNGASGYRRFESASTTSRDRRFGATIAPKRIVSGRNYTYRGRTFLAFHARPYRWPHGIHYRRYVVGYALPRRLWIRDYYIDNYADYDLEPPPSDFEWVRYGPDILLIDLISGQIAQVVYGAFDDTVPDDESADVPLDQPSEQ